MEPSLLRLALITAPLISASAAAAQSPGFSLVGFSPGGSRSNVHALSQDGSVAAGATVMLPAHPNAAFDWTRQTGRDDWGLLPGMPQYTLPYGLNSTGNVSVGLMGPWEQWHAYRRIDNGPMQDLGVLPGYLRSVARGVSGDGGVVVGAAEYTIPGPIPGTGGEAFRWTESGGMQGLGYLRPNGVHSQAMGISRDGSTIVGSSKSGSIFGDVEAFRWTQAAGMQLLPQLPGTLQIDAQAFAANADGSVIVGGSESSTGFTHAVRWTPNGIEDLALSLPSNHSRAYAVSDAGTVVGGTYQDGGTLFAFAWTATSGFLDLSEFLSLNGMSTPANYRLEGLFAISGDGLTFAGEARNLLTNVREGFVATIPSPATAPLLLAPLICPRRRRT